jgi:hypothetical protein
MHLDAGPAMWICRAARGLGTTSHGGCGCSWLRFDVGDASRPGEVVALYIRQVGYESGEVMCVGANVGCFPVHV